jgi:GT2 family glycosyltransferase
VSRVAIVVFGRNEGVRLAACLSSVAGQGVPVVYVDSGSTDGSPALARARGAEVLELDPVAPFSAARARNEGLARALALEPRTELVQFVDGDCVLAAGWLGEGAALLDGDPSLAAVCGRVRELHRERSIYNRLCDLEWDVPPGEARSCGGIAMMRAGAVLQAGGFDASLIAGEEPELCLRLRRAGWRILRTRSEMAWHDADMRSFGQWWRRTLRGGWGYAEGAALHAASPDRLWVRENRSILFWGALLPATALATAVPTGGASLLLLAGYPALAARIYVRARRRGLAPGDAALQAAFFVLAKFPQAIGQQQSRFLRAGGRRRRVVDWRVAG